MGENDNDNLVGGDRLCRQREGARGESSRCGSKMRAWVLAGAAIACAAVLAGCAAVYHLPGNAPPGAAPADNYFGREVPGYDDDLLLALSFSGGGSRAAAFSFGVLTDLDRSGSGPNQSKTLLY